MKLSRGVRWVAAAALLGSALVPVWSLPAGAAVSAAAAAPGFCRSSSHPALAARLARDIQAARRGRVSTVAVRVDDPRRGLGCWLHSATHFDSASVVKVTILGALLRKALDQHRFLTSTEAALASAMITRSDNNAASALWAELGRSYLRHFLNLAGMRQVIASQRWGVPAGAPTRLTVHVKNGWLPRATHGWRIHSIGCFTGLRGGYSIVVLTQDNPTMAYGIRTIEAIARAIHRDLNPGTTSVIALSQASPSWGRPDQRIPALQQIP